MNIDNMKGYLTSCGSYIYNKYISISHIYTNIYKDKRRTHNNILAMILSLWILCGSTLRYIKHRVTRRCKNSNDCTYTYKGKTYRIYMPRKKYYLPKIIEAQDLTYNKDIINDIREYAGPYENFHNYPTTPKNIGYSKIRITTMIGTEINVKEFTDDEVIKID